VSAISRAPDLAMKGRGVAGRLYGPGKCRARGRCI
jgi:hypothetical protein